MVTATVNEKPTNPKAGHVLEQQQPRGHTRILPPNQGSVGTREDSVQQRGKGSRLIVTSRKHIARNTIRPATPPRHTPDHAHTCNPGEETKHIRPLDTQPSTKPLNHTQTTNHDQRRWGMLNFLSPNTQAEPSTLQHAKQPGTLY